MESAEIISVSNFKARFIDKSVFPDAVGPTILIIDIFSFTIIYILPNFFSIEFLVNETKIGLPCGQ